MMNELLCHKLVTVQIAATNAVNNVANDESAQELLKECIPILIDRVKISDNDVLINFSLRALANLELKDANQLLMTSVWDITCLREIRGRDLPIEFKAPQSETLYSAIYGYEATELLLKRLNGLLSVPHEDVVFQVKKILRKVR